MKIRAIRHFTHPKGHTISPGTEIDISIRCARDLIAKGYAHPIAENIPEVVTYSKDNPPPAIQEIEMPEETQIVQPPTQERPKKPNGRRTWWDKLKSLWQAQA